MQRAASGKTLPDPLGEGSTSLFVCRRTANDEDAASETTPLPSQDGAHARPLLARYGPSLLLPLRNTWRLVLFRPNPETDDTRRLMIQPEFHLPA